MLQKYLKYVEIKTKITSVFPFFMGIAYLFFVGQPINWKITLVFFSSMFIFDLTVTAINNYIDSRTNPEDIQFSRKSSLALILLMLFASTILGLYLAYLTDLLVLMLGGISFVCGIFYTFGPLPISRQPLGELFSGIFYGLLIPFLLLYANMPPGTYVSFQISTEVIFISFQVLPLLTVLLLSIAPMAATSNIMLANNICDLEKDVRVKRHTLPYYLGNNALKLFALSYYAIYLAAIILVCTKILHPFFLIFLLTLIPVHKNIMSFKAKQEKKITFIRSIKNYIWIMSSQILLLILLYWIK